MEKTNLMKSYRCLFLYAVRYSNKFWFALRIFLFHPKMDRVWAHHAYISIKKSFVKIANFSHNNPTRPKTVRADHEREITANWIHLESRSSWIESMQECIMLLKARKGWEPSWRFKDLKWKCKSLKRQYRKRSFVFRRRITAESTACKSWVISGAREAIWVT